MSDLASVTVDGRTFDIVESTASSDPAGGEVWAVTVVDTEHWIHPLAPPAEAVLHFGDGNRVGHAKVTGLTWLNDMTVQAHLDVTLERA